ncbi:MAG: DHA2 family efflux MFS transporter permease subunit [Gaiellales bacterium]
MTATADIGTAARRSPEDTIFTREIAIPAAVVVLGAITTILDATIVNVALARLGQEFGTQISTIQWVTTAYLLAFAAVIPLTGWAADRFGAKKVWLASLTVFLAGSALCAAAQSIEWLIAARVVQGLGAGMILPLGQAILAVAAGPRRMGRVMSVVGVPMLLAPIFGPVLGGAIVDGSSWRWIFVVNLPVGLVALAAAARLLPPATAGHRERLDLPGALLAAGGSVLLVYGLAEVGSRGSLTAPLPAGLLLGGAGLLALFVRHALRAERPLIDVRLFGRRGFGAAAATTFLLGVALFGMLMALPLFFQIVRGDSPLDAGLLMVPQALGAAVAMPLAGVLTDRLGARRVIPAGIVLALIGTGVYVQMTAATSAGTLAAALFVIGLGLGATIMPSMAVAYASVPGDAVARATAALNTVQRLAGSVGTALIAVVLQRALDTRLPGIGGLSEAAGLPPAARAAAAPQLTEAFAVCFTVALVVAACALVPALALPAVRRRQEP